MWIKGEGEGEGEAAVEGASAAQRAAPVLRLWLVIKEVAKELQDVYVGVRLAVCVCECDEKKNDCIHLGARIESRKL